MTKCEFCEKTLYVIPTNHIMFCDEDCLADYVREQYERWRDSRMEAEC